MAQTKTVDGEELPASAFAYVGDRNDVSTWKLPIRKADGSVDEARLGPAAAALSPGGFRGQKVDLPAEAIGRVKKALVRAYKQAGKGKDEIPSHLLES